MVFGSRFVSDFFGVLPFLQLGCSYVVLFWLVLVCLVLAFFLWFWTYLRLIGPSSLFLFAFCDVSLDLFLVGSWFLVAGWLVGSLVVLYFLRVFLFLEFQSLFFMLAQCDL